MENIVSYMKSLLIKYSYVVETLLKWGLAAALLALATRLACAQSPYTVPHPDMGGHPQHATVQVLPTGGGFEAAHGERSGSDISQKTVEVPLGDVARQNREDAKNRKHAKTRRVN